MLEITTIPDSGPFYAGSYLMLTCTVEINNAVVDSPVAGTITWLKSGRSLRVDNRTVISDTMQPSTSIFMSTVELTSISLELDTGAYTCEVEINSSPASIYVQGVTQSSVQAISVQGKCICLNLCSYIWCFLFSDVSISEYTLFLFEYYSAYNSC